MPDETSARSPALRTEARLALERQIGEANRVAAAGLLAGGLEQEIKNPATAAVMNVELALSELEAGRTRQASETLRSADEALQGLVRLIRDHQQLARLGDNQPGPVDLGAVAEQVVSAAQDAAAGVARLGVEIRLAPPVFAVHGRLVHATLNLVVNAIRALDEAGRTDGRIVLRVDPTTAGAAFVVQDDGPGVDAAVQSRLFRPFVTTDRGAHLGLGLFVSRRMIEASEGSLTWRPLNPRGTSFRIHLPSTPSRVASPRR